MKRIGALLLGCLLAGSVTVEGASHLLFQQICNGFISRVNVGDFALVTSPALNIRAAPGTKAERLRDPLEPGMLVSIDQGPRCLDGYTWWQITVSDIQGWVAEGTRENYFLSAPVDPNEVGQQPTNVGTSGKANPNPPLSTLDGRPGGGNYEYACRGLSDGLIGRDPSTSSNVENGALIRFIPSLNMLEVDTPAICLGPGDPLDGNEAAFGPDGRFYQPTITPVYDDDDELQYIVVQLPLQAFLRFGRWTIQVTGFSIDVDVRAPGHPYVMYTFLNGGQMIVAGMQPNERFVANGTGNDGGSLHHFEARADGSGTFVIPLSQLPWFGDLNAYDTNSLYASVTQTDIIGEQESFVSLEGASVVDSETGYDLYRIPLRYSALLLREIVWGANYDEASAANLLRSWSCPGAAPIRLMPDESAVVAGNAGAQPIYSQPSVNAEVNFIVQPGDSVWVWEGVECSDNGVWWKISDDAWLMESQDNRYLWAPS